MSITARSIKKKSCLNLLLFIFVMAFSFSSTAKEAEKSKTKKRNSQIGTVKVEAAAVYKMPNFDSAILDYLDKGKKVTISMKTYPGAGGLGVFYKVKLANKKYGYLVDTEIIPTVTESVSSSSQGDMFMDEKSYNEGDSEIDPKPPLLFSRFIGGGVNMVNYTEVYEGRTQMGYMPLATVKLSGPGVLNDVLPLDIDLGFSMAPPAYYNKFSSSSSGFMAFGGVSLMSPLSETDRTLLYFGMGIMGLYENFKVTLDPSIDALDVQSLRLGAQLTLGYAFFIRDFLIRIDGKYYYESESYIGGGLYVQKHF